MRGYETQAGSGGDAPYRCPLQEGEQAGLFLSWMEGAMTAEESARLEEHAAGCASCRELMDGQKAVWAALEGWEPETVSQDFNRRLYAASDAEQAQPWWKRAMERAFPFPLRPAVPVAATCLLVIGVFLFQTPQPVELENKQAVVFDRVDVEQVDRSLDDLDLLRELNEELKLDASGEKSL
jgi:hypothetical protein